MVPTSLITMRIKKFVRSGIRTHAWRTRLRPERSALDRSAILTYGDYEMCTRNECGHDMSREGEEGGREGGREEGGMREGGREGLFDR